MPGGFLREGTIDGAGFRSTSGCREWAVRLEGYASNTAVWVGEDGIRSLRPNVPWCCYVDPETGMQCARAAAWRLVWEVEQGHPDDTDACSKHLAALLPRHTRTDVTPLEDVSAVDQLAHLA